MMFCKTSYVYRHSSCQLHCYRYSLVYSDITHNQNSFRKPDLIRLLKSNVDWKSSTFHAIHNAKCIFVYFKVIVHRLV